MQNPKIIQQGVADKFDGQKPVTMNQNTETEVNSIVEIVQQIFPGLNSISSPEETSNSRILPRTSIRSGRTGSSQPSERFVEISPLAPIELESLTLGSAREEIGIMMYGPHSRMSKKTENSVNKYLRPDPKSSLHQVSDM